MCLNEQCKEKCFGCATCMEEFHPKHSYKSIKIVLQASYSVTSQNTLIIFEENVND